MPTKSSALAHHFADLDQQRQAASLGMWVFLGTELMVFGALFTGYTAYHFTYHRAFAAGSEHLNLWFGAGNTFVLLTSSLTMALAQHAIQSNQPKLSALLLATTALLGLAFLIVKGFEYHADYMENLMPGITFDAQTWRDADVDPQHVKLFLLFYYFMTLIHALHLIIGIGALSIIACMTYRGRFDATYNTPVELGGLYWHFVDVIWVFLLPMLYLIGTN